MKNENKDEKIEEINADGAEVKESLPEGSVALEAEELGFDFDSLSQEEAVAMLKELVGENEELIAEKSALTAQIEKEQAESNKFKDNWYRTAAEFENFKKRNEFTRRTAYEDGIKDDFNPIFNIGDSIDRALSVELDEKTKSGVMLIKRQFIESLAALKVEEIDPQGTVFDPNTQEAITTIPTEDKEKDGTVAQVYKKGYSLGGKIIRYAQVVVYKCD
ncbi:MAG: nucleotide exchange factor GrpE [Clostridia bacterium]|nr:nucleotide exchange factor GrpE [Clostridia bacterium]